MEDMISKFAEDMEIVCVVDRQAGLTSRKKLVDIQKVLPGEVVGKIT